MKAVFTSLNTAFLPISRSRFKRSQIPMLITLSTIWQFCVNFWVIFRCFGKERFFLTLEPAIWSRDTGQQIPCFGRCQLIITWMSNIKEVNGKPRLHVSVNLLLGVWPPSCATPSSSPSWLCVRAHEQYR